MDTSINFEFLDGNYTMTDKEIDVKTNIKKSAENNVKVSIKEAEDAEDGSILDLETSKLEMIVTFYPLLIAYVGMGVFLAVKLALGFIQ